MAAEISPKILIALLVFVLLWSQGSGYKSMFNKDNMIPCRIQPNLAQCSGSGNVQLVSSCRGVSANSSCCVCDIQGQPTTSGTVCYVNNKYNTTISLDAVNDLDEDTLSLTLVMDNMFAGSFPTNPLPIDISPIGRLYKLYYIHFTQCYREYLQPYPIEDKSGVAFQNLTTVEYLSVNLALMDTNSTMLNAVKSMPNLRLLDISRTKTFGMKATISLIQQLNPQTIERLLLKQFQLIGGINYNGTLDIVAFFFNTTLPRLTHLDISDNSLYLITLSMYAGLSTITPNLQYVDASNNYLLDSRNLPFMFESVVLPSITQVYLDHQGVAKTQSTTTHFYDQLHSSEESSAFKFVTHRGFAEILYCVNKYLSSNISSVFIFNDENKVKLAVYNMLKCLIPDMLQFRMPYNIIPLPSDILNVSCIYGILLPMGGNVKILDMSSIHWETTLTAGTKHEGHFCVKKNNLTNFYFSDNSGWLLQSELAY